MQLIVTGLQPAESVQPPVIETPDDEPVQEEEPKVEPEPDTQPPVTYLVPAGTYSLY